MKNNINTQRNNPKKTKKQQELVKEIIKEYPFKNESNNLNQD